ncbi:MAG: glycosyltransferase family 2 protein [Bacteroidota bacterium]
MIISIVIPAFNLQDYIANCLTSIVNQYLEPEFYEVLVINDGSTDKTALVVEDFAKKYQQIKLFNKSNGGVSSARNLGIREAKGSYIFFVDGDDWLIENTLKKVHQILRTEVIDIARFGYHIVEESSNHTKIISIPDSSNLYSGIDFLIDTKSEAFFPWLYLVSRDFLLKTETRFNENLAYCEDKEFILPLMTKTNNFQNFALPVYNYRIGRQNAATTIYSSKYIEQLLMVNFFLFSYSRELTNSKHREYLTNLSINAIEKSYYLLTQESVYSRFKNWKSHVATYLEKNKMILKASKKLDLLYRNSYLFYLKYYLPRSIFHKLRNS